MAAQEDRPTGARAHLSDLVRDRRAALGISLAALEKRAVDPESGDGLKRSWLHRLETGEPVIPPQLPQLRALAAGLGAPLEQLQDAAAAQFFGIDAVYPASGDARALVERAERLTPDQRAQLLRLIDTFAPEANG
ncbi:helix-turn-helix transcriptional regulator [Streptomyces sp. DSM 44915]|uniref:Helix-turn-helix transcriptional regulator n=1 Tax=Streptomyces chisholmiae TaxID=3075540 RepID=A0ABU2JZ65_9ACTN|nr:helix-turn-helix transcriptional regulator [Streptomyces sp. DSM 44915]MDT0270295.1 helix-turn-helix transcriptional regulator [Streptomyces sp. DSM 44915]